MKYESNEVLFNYYSDIFLIEMHFVTFLHNINAA
jgi:hypothetical protein